MGLIVVPLLILYLVIGFFVVMKLGSLPENKSMQWLVKLVCVVVFIILLLGDAIVGRIYVKHLCSQDGGIVIHEVIEIDSSHFDGSGKLLFDLKEKSISELRIDDYEGIRLWQRNFLKYFDIGKRTILISDTRNKKVVATAIQYLFFGGWFEHISPGSVESCPNNISIEELLSKTFKELN